MLNPPKAKDRRCGFVVNGPEPHRLQWGENLPVRVCDLRTPQCFNGYSEGEANARLIAAAPDLLRSLIYISARLQHGGRAAKSDCLTQCQWAIAKATGGADQ